MEKICEFCTTSRPVVYCKSDAANLCLSCDAKVHSANALSSRHLRTLLCDLCRYRPSNVRCLDHKMFICCGCDQNLHEAPSQLLGCPSAKDFAALWGFELNEQNNNGAIQNQESTSFILQQILELKRLQLNGNVGGRGLQNLSGTDSHGRDSRIIQDWNVDSFPFPNTHLEQLPSSSTALQVDSFEQSNQFWSQTMQDLGVCEDISSHDDLRIPDVDLTFRNFEELFGGGSDHDAIRALLDDKDVSCSSVENEMSLDQSVYGNPTPVEDASVASIYGAQSVQMERREDGSSHILNFLQDFDFSHAIRPSYSTMSFTLSRFGNESNSTDCLDNTTAGGEASCNSQELDNVHVEARGEEDTLQPKAE